MHGLIKFIQNEMKLICIGVHNNDYISILVESTHKVEQCASMPMTWSDICANKI